MKRPNKPSVICLFILLNSNTYRYIVAESDEHQNTAVPRDYCVMELFKPRCWKNEVIIMQAALYGRKNFGRCIASDEDSTGCFANVLPQVDAKCSGKNYCEIRIPDPDLEITQPCPKSLKMYLEASYTCAIVVEEERSCSVLISTNPLHITSSSFLKDGCGSKAQPWTLEAPAGQRINMTLLDFTYNIDELALKGNSKSCQQYGYVIDKPARQNTSICGSDQQRENAIYVSASNSLQMVLLPQRSAGQDENKYNFLIKLEAIGCSDIIPPEDTWLKRKNDEIVIGCYSSRQTWHLQCQGHRWVGVVSNCTQSFEVLPIQPAEASDDHQMLAIAAVCVVGLTICLAIIVIGIICIKRYSLPKTYSDEKSQLKYNCIESEERNSSLTPLNCNGQSHLKPSKQTQEAFLVTSQQYAGSDTDRRNGNSNNQASMIVNSPYFVLDQELVARENANQQC